MLSESVMLMGTSCIFITVTLNESWAVKLVINKIKIKIKIKI